MTEYSTTFSNTKTSKLIFILSVFTCLFWFLGQVIDVYHFAVVGALFEIGWFPVVALTFLLPIVSFIRWVKEKFNLRSLYPYSIFIILLTIVVLVFLK